MRARYIGRFLNDEVRKSFAQLRERHRGRSVWPHHLDELRYCSADRSDAQRQADERLVADCDALAAPFRLGPDFANQIYWWLSDTRDLPDRAALACLLNLGAFGWTAPEIGGVETGREQSLTRAGHPIVEITREPLIMISISGAWDPADEPRSAARERLLRLAGEAIDANLDRIEEDARKLGFLFPDSRPNQDLHIDWLVERVRDDRTYEAIADRYSDTSGRPIVADTVRKAVREVAKLAGVELLRPT